LEYPLIPEHPKEYPSHPERKKKRKSVYVGNHESKKREKCGK